MAIYDKGADPIDYEAFSGAPCWIGVDMSKTTDLSSVVACFKDGDTYTVLPHFFCPEADIVRRGDIDGVNYASWAKQGFMTATPGNVIDNEAVADYIRGLCDRFDVREVGFDTAYAFVMSGLMAIESQKIIPKTRPIGSFRGFSLPVRPSWDGMFISGTCWLPRTQRTNPLVLHAMPMLVRFSRPSALCRNR